MKSIPVCDWIAATAQRVLAAFLIPAAILAGIAFGLHLGRRITSATPHPAAITQTP
jgi:predicted ABC-type sugar transport system permease subunit